MTTGGMLKRLLFRVMKNGTQLTIPNLWIAVLALEEVAVTLMQAIAEAAIVKLKSEPAVAYKG